MDEFNVINNALSHRRGAAGFSRTANDVVVRIPRYWYRVEHDTANTRMRYYISDKPAPGFTVHPAFNRGDGPEREFIYVGKYNTGAGYVSRSGIAPLVSITRATGRTGSAAKGAPWWQYDYTSWCAIWLLYLIEYADWDSQTRIGHGRTAATNTAAINNGGCDALIYHTGRAAGTNDQVAVQYRWIENLWGNVWEMGDGFNANNRQTFVCLNPAHFADDTGTNYTATGVNLPTEASGYIRNLGFSAAAPWAFLPTAVGGSETTFVAHNVWTDAGWRVLYLSGNWKFCRPGQGLVGLLSKDLVGKQGQEGMPVPKRVGYLYDAMLDKDLIRKAIKAAARLKRKRWDVIPVMEDFEGYVEKLYDMLKSDTYIPAQARPKEIYDSNGQKTRVIYVTPFFPDGVMNQLIVMVMEPVLMRGMYHWSCASVPGRGNHHAVKRVKRVIARDTKGTKYVCKIDIKQYYPSIDRKKLIWALARKIKDKKFLKLVYEVISTCPKGLAIGYHICQWLANFYLEPLDHYIMTLPGVKYMTRYMDDIVLFGPNKKQVHKARKMIEAFLTERLGLRMKGNWQVFPISARALDFVGYKFSRGYTTLRKRNFLRLTRQCRRAIKKLDRGERFSFKFASGLLSRAGQLHHCDSYKARVKYIDPIGVKNLKEVVRYESKRRLGAKRGVHHGRAA
jgi:retron-type reverse transcriptase